MVSLNYSSHEALRGHGPICLARPRENLYSSDKAPFHPHVIAGFRLATIKYDECFTAK